MGSRAGLDIALPGAAIMTACSSPTPRILAPVEGPGNGAYVGAKPCRKASIAMSIR
jgi:hypothetical protein